MSPLKHETLCLITSTNIKHEVKIEAQRKPKTSDEETSADSNHFTNNSINEGSFTKNHVSPLVPNIKLITVLRLYNCSLNELTADIHLMNLKELDVSKNNLTSVPECLYLGLNDLRCLNLSNNKIKEFNEPPMCARAIEKVDLRENSINELPSWIFTSDCNLGELLYCSNPQICPLKSDKVKPLNHSVKCLKVKNCQIVNNDLFYLKLFGKLSSLDLGNEGKVRSNSINSFEDMFNLLNLQAYLKVLLLNKLGIPEISSNIRNLSDLQELHAEYNNLSTLPQELVSLEKLRILKVGYNQLYELPADFNKLKNLEILEAQFNSISGVDFKNMPALRYVDLYHNDISDVYLDGNNSIEMIDLECNYVTDLDSLCKNYAGKRDRLREANGMTSTRIDGCIVDESCSEESGCPSQESDVYVCNETNEFIEEEDWDDQYIRDCGEITLSDSEYRGDVINEVWSGSCEPVRDSTFDYLYEDAD